LIHLEKKAGMRPDAMRRLAALGGENVIEALRLSKKASRKLDALRSGVESTARPAELGYRIGLEDGLSAVLLRAALLETPIPEDSALDVARGAQAVFPVKPQDLMPAFEGAALGQELKRLEMLWVKSDFTLGKADLLAA
jgi:poly(A) polymerase